jgi:CBS domain-containing protein
MSVGAICNREVVVVEAGASVANAARLMRDYHVGDLVVAQERAGERVPTGIVTDRDIVVGVLARDVAPDTLTVADIMSRDLLTARENDGVLETLTRMRAKGVRRVPVVTDNGVLAGILTLDDLLETLAEIADNLAHLVAREQSRERAQRR